MKGRTIWQGDTIMTRFLEDDSVVESDAGIIDANYWLKDEN